MSSIELAFVTFGTCELLTLAWHKAVLGNHVADTVDNFRDAVIYVFDCQCLLF